MTKFLKRKLYNLKLKENCLIFKRVPLQYISYILEVYLLCKILSFTSISVKHVHRKQCIIYEYW